MQSCNCGLTLPVHLGNLLFGQAEISYGFTRLPKHLPQELDLRLHAAH